MVWSTLIPTYMTVLIKFESTLIPGVNIKIRYQILDWSTIDTWRAPQRSLSSGQVLLWPLLQTSQEARFPLTPAENGVVVIL